MPNPYTEDYYINGKALGLSLYENYRYLPELTLPMVRTIINHLGMKPTDDVMDFGCARGYVVKAFREIGFQAFGVDCSEWAIDNCDPDVRGLVSLNDWRWADFDWIIAKDVLEHVEHVQETIEMLMSRARKGMLVVVPLSRQKGQRYVVPEYEKDVTHVHRLSLVDWTALFSAPGWQVEATYRIPGLKDNYAQYPKGNGFLVVTKTAGSGS